MTNKNNFKRSNRYIIYMSLIVPFSFLSCNLIHAAAIEQSDYRPGNPIYDKWDQFYKIEKTNPQQAEKLLLDLSKLTPQDPKVWKSLTYLQIRINKPKAALTSVSKAIELEPTNDALKLQQAYLYNQLKQDHQALKIFKQLTLSSDADIATKSKPAVENLSSGGVKPVFADIYFAPSYESRFDDGIFPLKIRYGKNLDQGRTQVYGFLSLNRDTQSTGISNQNTDTKIFDENAIVAGLGVNYQPWVNLPIRLYAEVGGSYDLIDRPKKNNPTEIRSKFRESVTAGVTGYQEWYANPDLHNRTVFNDYFTDLYGNVATYSREDYDVIGDFRVRSGFNVYRGEAGTVQAYMKIRSILDTAGENYNNLVEAGPGIAWQPFNYMPIKFRAERLYGFYFKDYNDKNRYNNTRFEMVFYKDF